MELATDTKNYEWKIVCGVRFWKIKKKRSDFV